MYPIRQSLQVVMQNLALEGTPSAPAWVDEHIVDELFKLAWVDITFEQAIAVHARQSRMGCRRNGGPRKQWWDDPARLLGRQVSHGQQVGAAADWAREASAGLRGAVSV